jgi:hypothetical protein
MYLRELGSVLAVLPGHPRYGGVSCGKAGITVRELFGNTLFFDRLRIDCHVVVPQAIAHSDFNRAHVGRAHTSRNSIRPSGVFSTRLPAATRWWLPLQATA